MVIRKSTTLKLEGSSGQAIRQCIAAVRRGGTVSVPGVYAGFIHGFLFGDAFEKGITFKMGQTHVQRHMPELLELIWQGKLHPGESSRTGCRSNRRPRATACSTARRTVAAR